MESIYFKKFMNLEKFKKTIDSFLKYDSGWYVSENICLDVLSTDNLFEVRGGSKPSWSSEMEQIHEKPTKTGWIDVYERQKVISVLSDILNRTGKKNQGS